MILKTFLGYLIRRLKKRLDEQSFIDDTVSLGNNLFVSGSKLEGDIILGENVKIFQSHLWGKIRIGDNTSIWGPNIAITSKFNSVVIGNYCSIARNVSIQEYNHKLENVSNYHVSQNIFGQGLDRDLSSNGPIKIGHDVWIGAGAILLSGVTIGNGAVIGANAVVTKDIPAFAIAAGNPAKVIRYRFDREKIAELEKLKWWFWTREKVSNSEDFFFDLKNGRS